MIPTKIVKAYQLDFIPESAILGLYRDGKLSEAHEYCKYANTLKGFTLDDCFLSRHDVRYFPFQDPTVDNVEVH